MSRENVEIVRRGYEALNQRDVDQFLSYFAPEMEVDFSESVGPFSDVYRGHAELKTFWESFFEAWDEIHWEIDELRDLGGDRVLTATHVIARGHGSGIPTTHYHAVIWKIRGGRIRRVKFFPDKQDALEAAGLPEQTVSAASAESAFRQIVDGISNRDLDVLQAVSDPAIEYTSRFTAVEGKTYRGRSAWLDYLADLEAAWEDFRVTIEELVPAGEGMLMAVGRVEALERESRIPIDQRVYAAW